MITLTTDCRNMATACCLAMILCGSPFPGQGEKILAHANGPFEVVFGPDEPAVAPPDPDSVSAADNVDQDVLMRGPVHEAFAAAHQGDAVASPLIDQTPPEAIEEIPPEYRPDGTDVHWIAGYWAWDESRLDFVWVSGIWREVPPGRRWVPGYWEPIESSFRWISGFWAPAETERLSYLPPPPASVDQGPSTPAPGEDFFYVPGNWDYQLGRYRWIAGHWRPLVANWIWIPAQYIWTPGGCVYIPGYWDYEMAARGVCFAPVYFHRFRPGFRVHRYTPRYVIHLDIHFLPHLFVRRGCRHYYFGDWYGKRFAHVGFQAWATFPQHHRRYDPLAAYYGCRRSAIDPRINVVTWAGQQHRRYVRDSKLRPSPTYTKHVQQLNHLQRSGQRKQGGRASLVSSYEQVVNRTKPMVAASPRPGIHQAQFKKISRLEKTQIEAAKKQRSDFQKQRRQAEHRNLPTKKIVGENRVSRPQSRFQPTRHDAFQQQFRQGIPAASRKKTDRERRVPKSSPSGGSADRSRIPDRAQRTQLKTPVSQNPRTGRKGSRTGESGRGTRNDIGNQMDLARQKWKAANNATPRSTNQPPTRTRSTGQHKSVTQRKGAPHRKSSPPRPTGSTRSNQRQQPQSLVRKNRVPARTDHVRPSATSVNSVPSAKRNRARAAATKPAVKPRSQPRPKSSRQATPGIRRPTRAPKPNDKSGTTRQPATSSRDQASRQRRPSSPSQGKPGKSKAKSRR